MCDCENDSVMWVACRYVFTGAVVGISSAARLVAMMGESATNRAFAQARNQKKKKRLAIGIRDLSWMISEVRAASQNKTTANIPPPREAPEIHYAPYNGVIDADFWQRFEQQSAEISSMDGTEARRDAVKATCDNAVAIAKKAADVHAVRRRRRHRRHRCIPLCETRARQAEGATAAS